MSSFVKKKFTWLSIATLIVILALATNVLAAPSTKTQAVPSNLNTYALSEILVKVKPGTSIDQANALLGGKTVKTYRNSGVARVKLPPGTSITAAVSMYGLNPNVVYAEPNYIRKVTATPNDEYLSDQWALNEINATKAWDISEGDPNVTIAVIDTGIDINHPDLQGKIVKPYNAVLDSTNPDDVLDDMGHGTHVAGIAAAAINNGIGIAGVGGNVSIMPIKAGDNGELYDSDIANAINYAVTNGARVINLSLGGYDTSLTLQSAISNAISHNVVVVAAAGNDAVSTPSYPAAYPGVIAVAATDETDQTAYFSNYGSDINISAPGTDILSTTPTYPLSNTDAPAPDYDYMSGTSMASPEVAGLAGLVISANPALTVTQVKDLIDNNADDIDDPGFDQYSGYGRIDAYKTLAAETSSVAVSQSTPANGDTNVSINTALALTFNKNISAGSTYSNITLIDANNQRIACSITISNNILTLDPSATLTPNTSYTLSVPTGALNDPYGNTMTTPYTLSFTTGKVDLTSPTVVGSDPANNANSVPLDKAINISFSEDVQAGTGYNQISLVDGANQAVPITSQINGNTLILTPGSSLQGNTQYTVSIPQGAVQDKSGNSLATPYSFTFATCNVTELPFSAADAVMDPNKPVLYATDESGYKLYSYNYETGALASITFQNQPESLAVGTGQYADELYVALLTAPHSSYTSTENQSGYIAVIDMNTLTLKDTIPLSLDPFDIIPGRDGKIYVTSGSGQWTQIQSYDRATKQMVGYSDIRQQSYGQLSPTMDRIYTIDTDSSPRNMHAYNISDGQFTDPTYPGGYNSPYWGDYPLAENFTIDPTGQFLFNGSGVIFSTDPDQASDMQYFYTLDQGFSDIAFEPDVSQFYTLPLNQQAVAVYSGSDFQTTKILPLTYTGKRLFRQSDKLVVLESASPTNDYVEVLGGFPTYGTISGTVQDSAGTPIADLEVQAWDAAGNYVNSAYTDSNGAYSLVVQPGTYKIDFATDLYNAMNGTSYLNQWFNNQATMADATTVNVTQDQTVADVSTTLQSGGGSISGQVTDTGGNPIPDVLIETATTDTSGAFAVTDSNGDYTIRGITPGTYNLLFDPSISNMEYGTNYHPQWYDNQPSQDHANTFSLSDGTVIADINAQLGTGPVLSVSEPTDNSVTTSSTVNVTGQTEPGCTVQINGNNVNVDDLGNFSSSVNLTPGSNSIVITATDPTGAVTTRTVTVQNLAPTLTVTSPADNLLTSSATIAVTGTTTTGSTVAVNGIAANVDACGNFAVNASLSTGTNLITIVATNQSGISTTVTRTVVYALPVKATLDTPTGGTVLSGKADVTGWLLDGLGVSKVEVLLDGQVVGVASYGDERPDVYAAFPAYNNPNAGFHYSLDTSGLSVGGHTLSIRETAQDGSQQIVATQSISVAAVAKGNLDDLSDGAAVSGNLNLHGWYLDQAGVAAIQVLVDGNVVGDAAYGDARPDVYAAYPEFNSPDSGFHYNLDTASLSPGSHTLTIGEVATDGTTRYLPSKTINVNIPDKGVLDGLDNGATLSGTVNLSGWYLSKTGVAKIDVLVDGNVLGEASYGDPRPDVYAAFPDYNNQNSGYHFSLNTTGLAVGSHTLTLRATGTDGSSHDFVQQAFTLAAARKGTIDDLDNGTLLSGTYNLYGWYLDTNGVAKIQIMVDGNVIGEAVYGDARPDVYAAFPDFNNQNAGYHYVLDTSTLSAGSHSLVVREISQDGSQNDLNARNFNVGLAPRGTVDGITDGMAVSGVYNVSGWFLDADTVQKIEVLVDNQVVGTAVYGDERPDVDAAFPAYNNPNSGFHYSLDTNSLSTGSHTLTVRETSALGSTFTLPQYNIVVSP